MQEHITIAPADDLWVGETNYLETRIHDLKRRLQHIVKYDFPEDCEETQKLNLMRKIHDSL